MPIKQLRYFGNVTTGLPRLIARSSAEEIGRASLPHRDRFVSPIRAAVVARTLAEWVQQALRREMHAAAVRSAKEQLMGMSFLDLDTFRAASLVTAPFNYVVTPGFVRQEALQLIHRDYPDILSPGSFPLAQLSYGPAFRTFVGELESVEFREAFEEKFKISLAGRPTTVTVRGRCAAKDGQIHKDSISKIITVLIYMNSRWEAPGGRLRLLRSGSDLNDVITEIPPVEGTMLAFKRAENSWHGHKPFVGVRRVVQFNWVAAEKDQRIAMLRHRVSSAVKRMVDAVAGRHLRAPSQSAEPPA